jgi:hypothetical protein
MRGFVVAAALVAWPAFAAPCLSLPHGPEVEVSGLLSRAEEGLYLHLRTPICTRASGDDQTRADVSLVQLILKQLPHTGGGARRPEGPDPLPARQATSLRRVDQMTSP